MCKILSVLEYVMRNMLVSCAVSAAMLAALAMPPQPASAKSIAIVKPTNACNFLVMSLERDPAGLNVRAGPSTKYAVLGTVPPIVESEGGMTSVAGPQFQVLGSRKGWLYVESIGEESDFTGKPERPMYKGRGWISGKKVFVNIQSTKGFVKPSAKSAIALNWDDAKWVSAQVQDRHILACQGVWAQFQTFYKTLDRTGKVLGKEASVTAWFRGLCGHFETTCDGLVSDY